MRRTTTTTTIKPFPKDSYFIIADHNGAGVHKVVYTSEVEHGAVSCLFDESNCAIPDELVAFAAYQLGKVERGLQQLIGENQQLLDGMSVAEYKTLKGGLKHGRPK